MKRSSCSDERQTSIEANLFLANKKNANAKKERKTKQNKRLATDTIRRRFKNEHERNLTSILKKWENNTKGRQSWRTNIGEEIQVGSFDIIKKGEKEGVREIEGGGRGREGEREYNNQSLVCNLELLS